jgi:uncharacterized SAM-binding protein YcdF (DUF218 family)
MFFVISKVVGFFLVPSNVLVGIGLIGIVLIITRYARAGTRLLIASITLLVIVGFFPIGTALTLPLEQRFPQWQKGQGAPIGIIILGGAVNPTISAARSQPALGEAAERITAAVELARRYPNARVVFSGGNNSLIGGNPSEATYAGRLLENLGVSHNRITLEARSRSTAENAAFTKRLLSPRPDERWLLITSAMHMPRAIGTFRAVGFDVEAYPVDYQTAGPQDLWVVSGALLGNLAMTDLAAHEWLGLLVYWITGRTSALFPSPMPFAR